MSLIFDTITHSLTHLINSIRIQAIGVGGEAASNGGDKMDVDGRKIHVGTHALGFRRDGMEVQSPFTDGIFSDWEAIESLWDHALK